MKTERTIEMKRFELEVLDSQKSVTVYCHSGSVWATAGEGFGDIVIQSGEQLSIIPNTKVIIEALEDSKIAISARAECAETVGQLAEI